MNKAERRMLKRIRGAQFHHLFYDPPVVVPIFRGEHQIVSLLQRLGYVSEYFMLAIDVELNRLSKKVPIGINPIQVYALKAARKKFKYDKRKAAKANCQDLLEKRQHISNRGKRQAAVKRSPAVSRSREGRKSLSRSI